MFSQFLDPAYFVFAVAFAVMIGIGLIEAVGLGIGAFDADGGLSGVEAWPFLEWLGLRSGLPILVWLTSLLACFTFFGVAIQQIAEAVTAQPLSWPLASGIALVLGFIANAYCSGLLAAIMPEYESSVISSEALLRRRGTVLEGVARRGRPARAKVVDQHGQAHFVMVEPHNDADVVAQGETALLVRRDGPLFYVLPDADSALTTL